MLLSPAFFSCCGMIEDGDGDAVSASMMDGDLVCTTLEPYCSMKGQSKAGASWWLIRSMDVFVFDEQGGTLDSYQRSTVHSSTGVVLWCGRGLRRVVGIANVTLDRDAIAAIGTYEDIGQLETLIREDNPEYPVMYGECVFEAGDAQSCRLPLEPVMCELDVELNNGMGAVLQEVSVYLTGVSARTKVFCAEEPLPCEIICADGIVEKELETMSYPRMFCNYLVGEVEASGSIGVSLYCYPNPISKATASLGSPVTTLHVEATVAGSAGDSASSAEEATLRKNGAASSSSSSTRNWSAPLDALVRGTRYDISARITK